MSAREAVLKVLGNRKSSIDAATLLVRVNKLTKRNVKSTSLTGVLSQLRKDGFQISRGPKLQLMAE